MNWSVADHKLMALALKLAIKGEFTARPNPMVGCVIVKNGDIIGQGWHQKYGGPHAEINALADARSRAPQNLKGATCYVTLEPCSFTGKTGPCANALVEAGISKVIAAVEDPNPQVSGNGFGILARAGVVVEKGLMREQSLELIKGFYSRIKRNRPWVTLKLAMSVDGRTALEDGSSQWITGKSARQNVQKIRARQDAILTGVGTVITDNPRMTVRENDAAWLSTLDGFKQPTRIILDRNAKCDPESNIFNSDAGVWWVADWRDNSIRKSQIRQWSDNSAIGSYAQGASVSSHLEKIETINLVNLLKLCAKREMNNVLVESGHRLAGLFLEEKLVDEIIIYMAPKLMGNQAMGLFDLNVKKMADSPSLKLSELRQFGDDIRMTYIPVDGK